MYQVFYLFRVHDTNVERFLRISGEAAEIYRRYGAVVSAMTRLTDGRGKYGCLGLSDVVHASPEEQIFIGVDSFRDVAQFHALMKQIDADPQIGRLYKEIQEVIDLKSIIRWEMQEVV